MWAARNGHEDIVRRLAAAAPTSVLRNGDGATATMITIVNDRFDLAATLLELGADANDGSLYHAVEMRDATTDWYAHDGSKLRNNFREPAHRARSDRAVARQGRRSEQAVRRPDALGGDVLRPVRERVAVLSRGRRRRRRGAEASDRARCEPRVDARRTPKGGGPGANANVGKTPLMAAINGGKGVPLSAGPGYSRVGPPPFREPSNRTPADAVRLLIAHRRERRTPSAATAPRRCTRPSTSAISRRCARSPRAARISGQERRRAHPLCSSPRSSSRTIRAANPFGAAELQARRAAPEKSSRCCAKRP